MKKLLLATLVLSTIITSCDSKNSLRTSLINIKSGKYFSMRQQTETTYVGVIQLSLPSLLSVAKTVNGKPIIDENLKADIMAQQAEVIERLRVISPDIKILNSYRLVLNAIAFSSSSSSVALIKGVEGVHKLLESASFERPETLDNEQRVAEAISNIKEKNSVTFIGADKLHKLGITGKNVRVGIIDSGIDYTHIMFGGAGKKEIYDSIDPDTANLHFPNAKVVGGVDFVGSNYSARDPERRVPKRDPNPIDERGHGTYVAGSIAGVGDDLYSYSGVAPDALLYALKVFSTEATTSDAVVIAALEYAADPSENIDPTNRLDVVNVSLGGSYGRPNTLYAEAIKNLTKAGTIVVAASGNSGDVEYVTNSPATSEEAISVAASIDYTAQNIEIPSVELQIGVDKIFLELVEGNMTAPARKSKVSGGLVAIGSGAGRLPEELKSKVRGNIVLMDLGAWYARQFLLAQSLGATGIVMINNDDGPLFKLDTEDKFDIPVALVSKSTGLLIKEALRDNKEVNFNFSSDHIINREHLVDTIAYFSSRGPRSLDSLIKPEIAGPGLNIISAEMGTGDKVSQKSGTSMAGPHIAGAMALLRQAFPTASVQMLKARLLNNAKILMENGVHVPVARQGAGRIQVEEAYHATVVANPATLSLGEVSIASSKVIKKDVTLTNTSDKDVIFSSQIISSKNIEASLPQSVKVDANSTKTFTVSFTLTRTDASINNVEADGFLILTSEKGSKISLPFLAVLNKESDIRASDLVTQVESSTDAVDAGVKLTLTNSGESSGDALIFNLLGQDQKKINHNLENISANTICDLEAAGIRILEKTQKGQNLKVLQIAIKLYDSLTFWNPCDVSLQIDFDNDGIADQELLGIRTNRIAGIATPNKYSSMLLDAKMSREIRYQTEMLEGFKENYTPALINLSEMTFYNHSNVAVIETDLSKILKGNNGQVRIKLAVSHLEAITDDFLADHGDKWQEINLSEGALAYYGMPETVTVKAGSTESVTMKRGQGSMSALILYPHNTPASVNDQQSQILIEKALTVFKFIN